MLDEIYLQKGTQFYSGEYIDANEDDEDYKGIIVFMITVLENIVLLVIKVCPEITVNGRWLSQEIWKCIFQVTNTGFF